MPRTEVAACLIFPGNVKLGISGRRESVVFYVSGNADDDAPFVLRAKTKRLAQRVLSVGEKRFRERFTQDYGLLRWRAILLAKAAAVKDRNAQRWEIGRSDIAIANHSAGARAEFGVPRNFNGRQKGGLHAAGRRQRVAHSQRGDARHLLQAGFELREESQLFCGV